MQKVPDPAKKILPSDKLNLFVFSLEKDRPDKKVDEIQFNTSWKISLYYTIYVYYQKTCTITN